MSRVVYTLLVLCVCVLATAFVAEAAHPKWSKMTTTQKRDLLKHRIRVERTTVRWWVHHRREQTREKSPFWFLQAFHGKRAVPRYARCKAIGVRAPKAVCVKATKLRHDRELLAKLDAYLAVPDYLRERGLGLPPQWFLNDIACIRMGESTDGAGSSNLYGMLQGWYAAGGTDHPNAWEASPTEQLYRTWILYNMYGWSPWSTAPGCGL